MSDWKFEILGNVAKIKGRIGWKGYKTSDLRDNGPIVFSGTEIKSKSFIDFSKVKHLTQEKFDESPEIILQDKDIMVATRGSLGQIGFYKIEYGPATINPSLVIVSDFKGIPEFLYYYFISNQGQENILAQSSGTTIPAIYQADLKKIKIPFPSLNIQKSISEILSSLDDKIELNNKINQELESLAQLLFKRWFVDFEFPNDKGEPYKASGGEMVDSELGEIPKGWKVVTIDDVTEIVTKGTTPTTIGGRFTEKGINFIKVESLTESGAFIKSRFAHIDDETNLLLKRSVIKEGDVLFSIAGTIGRVAVVTNIILPANTNQAIAIIRPNKISSYFLKMLMQSSHIQNDTQSNIVQAVQANLSLSVIKSTKFILPLSSILSRIDIQLNSIYDNINLLTNENESLAKLRDTLLTKLISGELKINDN